MTCETNSPIQRQRTLEAGQSVVEFALVLPVILFMVVAIADFGRLYTSAVAIESAAREAADYGAFDTNRWSVANESNTVIEMQHRACVAAAGSHLEGYESTDPTNYTCTNPAFVCTLELGGVSADCGSSGGFVGTTDCSAAATEPPCTVHVRLDYDFTTLIAMAPLPGTIHLVRESRFRISDLDLAPP